MKYARIISESSLSPIFLSYGRQEERDNVCKIKCVYIYIQNLLINCIGCILKIVRLAKPPVFNGNMVIVKNIWLCKYIYMYKIVTNLLVNLFDAIRQLFYLRVRNLLITMRIKYISKPTHRSANGVRSRWTIL